MAERGVNVRRAAKVDANQGDIVETLENMGFSVLSLAAVGKGCPDLLVGSPHGNWLIEIKDGAKSPSRRVLTDDQERFWNLWSGPIDRIETVDQAIEWGQHVRRRGASPRQDAVRRTLSKSPGP